MTQQYDIKGMVSKIKSLRKDAEELKKIGAGIPTVEKNVDRILADIRILEVEVVDAASIIS
jgi:hypothetical protein